MAPVDTRIFSYGLKEIEYLTERDPILGKAMEKLGRVSRTVIPDVFQARVYAVIGQVISARTSRTIWQRMRKDCDAITPGNLSSLTAGRIQQYGMTMKKAVLIKELADQVAYGQLRLSDFSEMTDSAVIRRLTAVRGIGQWTGDMILINCLERPDVLPWGDGAVKKGMRILYGLSSLEKAQFDRYRRLYSPYASTAAIYFWKLAALESEMSRGIRQYLTGTGKDRTPE